MEVTNVKRIISENSENIAFLIGNGINIHYNENNLSWKKLLLELWDKYSNES